MHTLIANNMAVMDLSYLAQSAEAVEYVDCISAERLESIHH